MTDADGASALAAAQQCFASGDFEGVVAHTSAAIRAFTAAGDQRAAAMACAQLGQVMANFMGNFTAARAWFARAIRLANELGPCVEQGWVALAAMGCEVDDPEELRRHAELALDRARRFGDLNLEAKALADGGLALVRLGRIAEGNAMLDEAMALVCGPADDRDTASRSVCSFFTACYATADFRRAGSWNDLLRQRGIIADEVGGPIFLRSHCDSVQAALLVELGRWTEAEQLLLRSMADFETINRSPSWHPAIELADLRIRQGRLAEAEVLLVGRDAWMEGLVPSARLHLARGDHELALATAHRGLAALRTDRMRAADLWSVVITAKVGLGDLDGAASAADEMDRRLGAIEVPSLRARCAAARARLECARGDHRAAAGVLAAAIALVDPAELPWSRFVLVAELAACLDRAGDRAAAQVQARHADVARRSLDVVLTAEQTDVVTRLAVGAASPPAPGRRATMGLDGTHVVVDDGTTRVRLAASKGLRYLHALVSRPGVEQHALDLVDRVEGVAGPGVAPDRRRLGDAGPMLDAAARTAYRHRIEAGRAEIDDALAIGDLDRAEALQGELDALVGELARAFGIGGRDRAAASVAERARLNVTRAIRSATAKLIEELPEAGAALDRHVRTGTYCCYEPVDGEREIRWIVQSAVNGPRPR